MLDDFRGLNDPVRRRGVERRGGYFVVEGSFALDALLRLGLPGPHRCWSPSGRRPRCGRSGGSPRRTPRSSSARRTRSAGSPASPSTGACWPPPTAWPCPTPADLRGRRPAGGRPRGPQRPREPGGAVPQRRGLRRRRRPARPHHGRPAVPAVSVRVSLGHVLHVPWARPDAWPGRPDAGARPQMVALTPDRRTPAHRRPGQGSPPARVALLLGAEGPGLTPAHAEAADAEVRIPLATGVDSLNVATAAGRSPSTACSVRRVAAKRSTMATCPPLTRSPTSRPPLEGYDVFGRRRPASRPPSGRARAGPSRTCPALGRLAGIARGHRAGLRRQPPPARAAHPRPLRPPGRRGRLPPRLPRADAGGGGPRPARRARGPSTGPARTWPGRPASSRGRRSRRGTAARCR